MTPSQIVTKMHTIMNQYGLTRQEALSLLIVQALTKTESKKKGGK